MNFFKALYLLSAIVVVLALSCEEATDLERDTEYVTQKDIDEIKSEDSIRTGVFLSNDELKGMQLFMRHCNRCHPAAEKGKGPSLVDKKILPDFLIHFQVRNGLGDMPAFKKEDLPKEDVKKIILFVRLMRENYHPS